MENYNDKFLLLFLLWMSFIQRGWGDGQAATIVYSRDNNCMGKEFIRAYTGQCTRYLNSEESQIEYMKFSCGRDNGFVSVQSYIDAKCEISVGNVTEVASNYRGDGSCQKIFSYDYNYLSAQLFCESSDDELQQELGSNMIKNKITFRYYSNYDTSCASYPSVIEMWTEDICLYYEPMGFISHDSYVSTGMYGIYSQEVSESGWGNVGVVPTLVSLRYFNTNDCRQHSDGPIEGEPPPGGIGSPVRHLRALQEGGEGGDGQIGGPDGQQQSEIFNADYKMGECVLSAPAQIHTELYHGSLVSIYSSFSIASVDSELNFDFCDIDEIDGKMERDSVSFDMSTSVILASWGFLGAVAGMISYLGYGFYLKISGADILGNDNKKIIQEAKNEHEMSSISSGHGLLDDSSIQRDTSIVHDLKSEYVEEDE